MIAAGQPRWHPRAVKPSGLVALETAEDRQFRATLDEIMQRPGQGPRAPEVPPLDPNAPRPGSTRLYNNLLDNLLSSLHYFYKVAPSTVPDEFVASWDPQTGARVIGNGKLLSLESNTSYLLALELYRGLHAKAIFDEDLVFARERVSGVFSEEWHTGTEWPIGSYFDLVQLYNLTGDQNYISWADRLAAGDGPDDPNTPLAKARSLAMKFQYEGARVASPIYFLHAALLADWGKRHNPAMVDEAKMLFEGLRVLLLDPRYNMLWKQVSIATPGGSERNIIQTFDTLEQLSAIKAILDYGKASGDPEAMSLAKVIMQGVWEAGGPLLIEPPRPYPSTTFFGLHTAVDIGREAKRLDPAAVTLDHVLLFEANVLLNEATRGEYRSDVDFLSNWMEDSGPVYREAANGYYTQYEKDWLDPENPAVSAKAAIWTARALAEDERYRFQTVQSVAGNPASPSDQQ
jgi:hypothetical protein